MVKTILGFLKRQAFTIICTIVGLGSIGLGVMGMTSMSDVTKKLEEIRTLHGAFAGPTKTPVNHESIAAEKKRVESIQQNYAALLERAYGLDKYEPLQPPNGETFFPEPTADGRRAFADVYRQQFTVMLERLRAGSPPSATDVDREKETMEEEKRVNKFREPDDPTSTGKEKEKGKEKAADQNPSGLITDAAAKESPAARAAIRRARGIYCYCIHGGPGGALDEVGSVYEGLSPKPADMWRAQVGLWVQRDVVESLARVNDQAAAKLLAESASPWVGTLPVKELASIRVSDYVPVPDAGRGSGSPGAKADDHPLPSGRSDTTFTKNQSTDLYDVVQFTLKLVIDVRKLPLIIDAICKDRFHTLLNVSYSYDAASLESLKMEGRIYGSQPTATVVLDFETIFFADKYRPMMPAATLAALGKERPKAGAPATGQPPPPGPGKPRDRDER